MRTRGPSIAIVVAAALLVTFAALADTGWYERHVAPNYCIDRPTWPWQLVRVAAAVLAVVLVAVVRPRLARALARLPARELLVTGAWSVVALAAALGVVELYLRHTHWDERPRAREVGELQTDARLGWTLLPDRTLAFDEGGRRFTYHVDARGERVPGPGGSGDPDAPTLVVAGESIAFGHGLDWDETFYARVGRALGLEVVNAAVVAYSTGQAYLRLLDTLPRLSRPRLVVMVFVPIQIQRNVARAKPHFTLDEAGKLTALRAETGFASWRLARLFSGWPYHDRTAVAVTRAILVATAAAVRARGAEPLFLVANYGPPCRDPEPDALGELFAGLPHVRVDLTPSDVIGVGGDDHPNAAGSQKIADAILAHLARSSPSFSRKP